MKTGTSIMTRREFMQTTATGLATLGLGITGGKAADALKSKRKFSLGLSFRLLGVPGDAHQLLDWAAKYGFESIEPPTTFLEGVSENDLREYRQQMKNKNFTWSAFDLPTDFRRSDAEFEQGMQSLPAFARTLQRAEVTRVTTWIMPGDRSLTYQASFRMNARRLREVARVLDDHGIRLGLEYVGPRTAWASNRYPFVHTLAEARELVAEIGKDNVGFNLDSWHWYTAEETRADLLTLRAKEVVMCHLNDAPKGIPVGQQVDNHRELPCATGVIDVKGFLGALIEMGYDGPVACEPFNQELRNMSPEQAVSTVASAMTKACELAEAG
jgi:sugar phosphate isomerase/epimerase